jgi:porin-like protein
MVMRLLNIVTEMPRQKNVAPCYDAVPSRFRRPEPQRMRRASMDRRIALARGRSILRPAAAAAAAIMAISVWASGALAQTLSDPNSPPKWSPPESSPKSAAKSPTAARLKSCGAYGAGFVNVPGTDTCIKIGGWVRAEGGSR